MWILNENLLKYALIAVFGNFCYLCCQMKKIRFLLYILATVLATANLQAQEKKKVIKGFSGGMMVNAGYVFGQDSPSSYNIRISDATFGLGGCAKLHFTEHFRAGFEGYFSSAPLHRGMERGSHNKLFWSGALADWFWTKDKFRPYVGVTVGGGMETALYMFEGDKHDWLPEGPTILHKQGFFAVDPYAGVEYAVGKALRLTLKADWLIAINSDGFNRPTGPRIYFGIIFAR